MRIVDRKTFIAMPEGTVFAKFSPLVFGDLMIKGRSYVFDNGGDDFSYQPLNDSIECDGSDEWCELLEGAIKTGKSLPLDLNCQSRDGLFDTDQLFAVWEKADVVQLIERLQRALCAAA